MVTLSPILTGPMIQTLLPISTLLPITGQSSPSRALPNVVDCRRVQWLPILTPSVDDDGLAMRKSGGPWTNPGPPRQFDAKCPFDEELVKCQVRVKNDPGHLARGRHESGLEQMASSLPFVLLRLAVRS